MIGSRTRSGGREPSLSRTSVSYRVASYPYRIRIVDRISYRVASHHRIRIVSIVSMYTYPSVSIRIAWMYPYRMDDTMDVSHPSYPSVLYHCIVVSCRVVALSLSYRIVPCRDRIVFVSYPYRTRVVSRTSVSYRIVSYRYRYRIVSVSYP